jgi:hypothetical protein
MRELGIEFISVFGLPPVDFVADRGEMNQLAEDLRAAKAYLAEHGRCAKGAQDVKAGTCCPIMAIAGAIYDDNPRTDP